MKLLNNLMGKLDKFLLSCKEFHTCSNLNANLPIPSIQNHACNAGHTHTRKTYSLLFNAENDLCKNLCVCVCVCGGGGGGGGGGGMKACSYILRAMAPWFLCLWAKLQVTKLQ